MAAAKANYLILYKTSAQVYTATNLTTAVKTPLPKGCKMEDRIIMFMSYLPDQESLCVYLLTDEQLDEEKEKIEMQRLKEMEQAAAQMIAQAAGEEEEEETADVEVY